MLLVSLLTAVVGASCPADLANGLDPQPSGRQLITVETRVARTSYATLQTWRKVGRCWRAVDGPYAARVGVNGVRTHRREGDGTTPAGTFRIGRTMYGVERDPGVRHRYVRLRCGDWWVEDPRSPAYNTFQRVGCGVKPPFRVISGDMASEARAFRYLAVVEFNMRPVVRGRGSGIFLHAQTGGPTAGCISLARPQLLRVLRWLAPGAEPRIVIGTRDRLRG